MANKKGFKYSEPAEYFPRAIRKKMELGEFAEQNSKQSKPKIKQNKGK